MSAVRRSVQLSLLVVLCGLAGAVTPASAQPMLEGSVPLLNDQFDGGSLSSEWVDGGRARWCEAGSAWRLMDTQPCNGVTQTTPAGSLTVGNGVASFRGDPEGSAQTKAFPFILSRNGGFPATGDFVVEIRMRYSDMGPHGNGMLVRPWSNATLSGNNPPSPSGDEKCASFRVWGDTGSPRLVARLADQETGVPVGAQADGSTRPGALEEHVYRLEYVGGQYLVFIDGHYVMGPVRTTVRADRMWLGHAIFTSWGAADWSDFDVSSVEVSQPAIIDGNGDGVPDGAQLWPRKAVPASAVTDGDGDGKPDLCDTTVDQPGKVVVVKDAQPDSADDFGFTTGGGLAAPTFSLDDDADPALSNRRSFDVAAGTYTVTEAAAEGWALSSLDCDDGNSGEDVGSRTATYRVESGETVTCTFTNAKQGGSDDPTWQSTEKRWCKPPFEWRMVGLGGEGCQGLRQNPPSATEAGGVKTFDVDGSGTSGNRSFPYEWTANGTFPTSGDFYVEATMTYSEVASHGGGLLVRRWPNATPDGANTPWPRGDENCSAFRVWGDSAAPQLRVNLAGIRVAVPGAVKGTHRYRLQYVNGKYMVFVDGQLLIGPLKSTMRADRMWLGNPGFTDWGVANWSDFQISEIKVKPDENVDYDNNGDYDGTQAWTPTNLPPSAQEDSDNDGLPDNCDPVVGPVDPPQTGEVVVVKEAQPATGRDFGFTSNGLNAPTFKLDDDDGNNSALEDSRTFTVAPGTYTVTESHTSGWKLDSLYCDDGDSLENIGTRTATYKVDVGETVTCRFTNIPDPPGTGRLEVRKKLLPAGDAGRFDLNIDGGDAEAVGVGNDGTTGEQIVSAGEHTVVESAHEGTSLGAYDTSRECRGDDGEGEPMVLTGPEVPVAEGDDVVCTFTNVRRTGTLEVRKSLAPASDPGRFDLDIGGGDAEATAVGNGGSTGKKTLPTGSYSVSERAAEGTDMSLYGRSLLCKDGGGDGSEVAVEDGKVQVGARDDIVCTFSNVRKGRLELRKDLVPNDDPGRFDLNIGGGDPEKTGAGDGDSTGEQLLTPGTYTVSESASPGTDGGPYDASLECRGDNGQGEPMVLTGTEVPVSPGADVVCIWTNQRHMGRLELRKDLEPNDDPGRFDLNIDGGDPEKTGAGDGDSTGERTVRAGTYTVTEAGSPGTTLAEYAQSLACRDNDGKGAHVPVIDGNRVPVGKGDDVVCTFTNRAVADLSLTKSAPMMGEVGTPLTYRLAVSNAGPSAARNVVVSDELPSVMGFESASHSGTHEAATRTVRWNLGTLRPNESVALELVVRPRDFNRAYPERPFVNTATVSSSTDDVDDEKDRTGTARTKVCTELGTNGDDQGANAVVGESGDDLLCGQGGADVLDGKGGDDIIQGDGRLVVPEGGESTEDWVTYETVDAAMPESFGLGKYFGAFVSLEPRAQDPDGTGPLVAPLPQATSMHGTDTLGRLTADNKQGEQDVENVKGSEYRDRIVGDGGANALWGWKCTSRTCLGVEPQKGDVLHGEAGPDALYGAGEAAGTTRTDRYTVPADGRASVGDDASSDDALRGGAGDDTMAAGGGDHDLLGGGLGNDDMNGGKGAADVAWYLDALPTTVAPDKLGVRVNLSCPFQARARTCTGIGFAVTPDSTDPGDGKSEDTLRLLEAIAGSYGADELKGSYLRNDISGGAGHDWIYGYDGADATLSGGDGNDHILGGDDNDVLVGLDGRDYMFGGEGRHDRCYAGTPPGNDAPTEGCEVE